MTTYQIKHKIYTYDGRNPGLDGESKGESIGRLGNRAWGAGGGKKSTEVSVIVSVDDSAEVPSCHSECATRNDVGLQGSGGGQGVWLADAIVTRGQGESGDILGGGTSSAAL